MIYQSSDRFSECSIVLSNGRRLGVAGGVIGLDVEDLSAHVGYDGNLGEYETGGPLSQAERREVASYMISKWAEFAEKKE
jgi:hypothetical protein